MAYEIKPNSGSLFVNDKKEKPNHPDFKGQAIIEGVACWLSAWKKEAKDGKMYLSLSFQPKDDATKADKPVVEDPFTAKPKVISTDAPFDDDIPF
jgi:uncharacterized protein (DUF736 family)